MASNAKHNEGKIVEKICRITKLLCIVEKRKRMLQEFGRRREAHKSSAALQGAS